MNREYLDSVIKKSLVARADNLLVTIGASVAWTSGTTVLLSLLKDYERTRAMLSDDTARLKIVDEILKAYK